MPLINTQGLTILGDGSGWFWAMAGFLAIPVTGYMIYSQLRGQRSANRVNAMGALRREWASQPMVRHALAVLMHHAQGKPGWPPSLARIGAYLERLAILEKRGDVHAEDVWDEWGYSIQAWWIINAAAIAERRKQTEYPRLYEHWERLAKAMAEISRREGLPPLDLAAARATMPHAISDYLDTLRVEQEANQGVIPAWPPAQAAEEAHA